MLPLSHNEQLTEDDVPEEVEALHVVLLVERLQDVAALRVEDAHGLRKVVSLHHGTLRGVERRQH